VAEHPEPRVDLDELDELAEWFLTRPRRAFKDTHRGNIMPAAAEEIRSLREEVEEQKEHGVRLMHGPDCEGCQSVRRMLRGSDA
jgi:hypothetical protein